MKTRQTNHHLKLHIPELSQNKKLWDYSHNQYLDKTFNLKKTNYRLNTPRETLEDSRIGYSETTDHYFGEDTLANIFETVHDKFEG